MPSKTFRATGQLDRPIALGNILLESEIVSSESADFLEKLCDEENTDRFFNRTISKAKKL
jgi:hypothetical protein